MYKINSFLKMQSGLLCTLIISLALLTSCSSQYHWVKVKSADPHFQVKSDHDATQATNTPNLAAHTEQPQNDSAVKPSSSLATPADQPYNTGMATASAGDNDLEARAELKAEEIKSSLSEQRRNALASENKDVRKEAIRQTIHDQLAKNQTFSKMSDEKKAVVENKLVNKTVKMSNAMAARGGNIAGFNRLLLVGLILIAVGLIFLLISGVVGTVFTAIGLVLTILGLIQMLS